MKQLPHLAQRLFNVPIAIAPHKAEIVMAALADRFGIARLFRPSGDVVMLGGDFVYDGEPAADTAYEVVNGVAIIPISGTLVNKLGSLRPYSGMTGYDGIRMNLGMALQDDAVDAIVLDIDSPGGEVAGCFDLVDTIFDARGVKPIWAILTENAFSAAYAIASAADKIMIPRTGGIGHVGAILMHVDMSKALAASGLTVTLITYGDHKADGHPAQALSKDALTGLQAEINTVGELFVKTVARNRNLSAAAVRGTQASTFLGAAGVEIGFADAVMAPDQAFRALLAELG